LELEFFKSQAVISIIAAAVLFAVGHGVRANDAPRDTAALPTGIDLQDAQTSLPAILQAADADIYGRIFEQNKMANGVPQTVSLNSSAIRCSWDMFCISAICIPRNTGRAMSN
jgi:hypothetical protein